jgi:hypothetical protein
VTQTGARVATRRTMPLRRQEMHPAQPTGLGAAQWAAEHGRADGVVEALVKGCSVRGTVRLTGISNFARVHQTLRVTPVMEATVSTHVGPSTKSCSRSTYRDVTAPPRRGTRFAHRGN